jgi:hypothetical protein
MIANNMNITNILKHKVKKNDKYIDNKQFYKTRIILIPKNNFCKNSKSFKITSTR